MCLRGGEYGSTVIMIDKGVAIDRTRVRFTPFDAPDPTTFLS